MRIDFWFDPLCPWCWITSRWIVEVAAARQLDVHWRSFSLFQKNELRPSDEDHADELATRRMLRVCEAVREARGEAGVGVLYTVLGTTIHHDDVEPKDVDIARALAGAGLPGALLDAADDDRYDGALRASLDEGVALAGDHVGTPLVGFNGAAFFGPVMTPAPTGEAALRLFDAVAVMTGQPGFYELKRSREQSPEFGERPAVPPSLANAGKSTRAT